MKGIFAIYMFLFFSDAFAAEALSLNEINRIFSDSVRSTFLMQIPVYKAYRFSDTSGTYIIVFMQKLDKIENGDTIYTIVRARCFEANGDTLGNYWGINGFVQRSDIINEKSIWFWTQYCEFKDLDNDGIIDPLIVYGTSGANDTSDRQIVFYLLYQDQLVRISHWNSTLDHDRNLRIDEAFYQLPGVIQDHVKEMMMNMADNKLAIFPNGWQHSMQKKKTYFGEKIK